MHHNPISAPIGAPSPLTYGLLKDLLLLLTLSTLLTACGKPPSLELGGFKEYVSSFQSDYTKYRQSPLNITNLIINFDNLPPKIYGQCAIQWPNTPTISIDRSKWTNLTEESHKLLVYHELGHCVLNQVHRDHSIMQATLLNEQVYENAEDYYLKELFD